MFKERLRQALIDQAQTYLGLCLRNWPNLN